MEKIIRKCLPTYEVLEKLGEGLYGSVYRVRDRFKERAVKIVPIVAERSLPHGTAETLDSKISRDFHSVRAYYESIRGKGVVDVYDFHLIDPPVSMQNAKAYLVILMELHPENLQNHVIDNFPLAPERAVRLMADLADVLARLSRCPDTPCMVTDLKPSNLLLTRKGDVLIGDLGGLKSIVGASTVAGPQFSPSWCAPEIVLKGERPQLAATVYAYGLVAFFLWEGALPYADADFSQRPLLLSQNGVRFRRADVPESVQRLVSHCLAFDAGRRPARFEDIHRYLRPDAAGPAVGSPKDPVRTSHGQPRWPVIPVRTHGPVSGRKLSGPGKTWAEPITKMTFVQVPPGAFRKGAMDGDGDTDGNEKPAHQVRVEPFWIGKFPVTQGQWETVMGGNPARFKDADTFPVEQVTWSDAVIFLQRLNRLHQHRHRFWLPAESQWEFAARSGGLTEIYSGGGDAEAVSWHKGNSGLSTHPVGEKAPNGLGIYDMSGNVLEWCADLYREDAYRSREDPDFCIERVAGSRAVRGGSWADPVRRCRTTARRGVSAGLRYSNLGFRVVRLA